MFYVIRTKNIKTVVEPETRANKFSNSPWKVEINQTERSITEASNTIFGSTHILDNNDLDDYQSDQGLKRSKRKRRIGERIKKYGPIVATAADPKGTFKVYSRWSKWSKCSAK